MTRVAEILLLNAVGASALALVVAATGRFVRRPGVLHVGWMLVLLKLVTPPVIEVGVLPGAASGEPAVATSFATATGGATTGDAALRTGARRAAARPELRTVVRWVWVAGSAALLLLAWRRAAAFRRMAAQATGVPLAVREAARELALRLGLPRCPPIHGVPGRISPMLWGLPGDCRILLPRELLVRLDVGERNALLAHELAHLARRDHWVRLLETAAMIAFWWHPVVWWARRNLRLNEERSCDARVLESLPGHERAYATALLKTLEFLAGRRRQIPLLATGANSTRHLEERVTMILDAVTPRRLTASARAALALLAVAALALFPTWADRKSPDGPDALRDSLRELHEQEIELQHQMQQLQERRVELERALAERRAAAEHATAEQDELRSRLESLRESGRLEQAERLAAEAAELAAARADATDRKRRQMLSDLTEELEFDLQEILREIEEADARGDDARVGQLRRQAAERKAALEDTLREIKRKGGELERDRARREHERRVEQLEEQERVRRLEELREQQREREEY